MASNLSKEGIFFFLSFLLKVGTIFPPWTESYQKILLYFFLFSFSWIESYRKILLYFFSIILSLWIIFKYNPVR